MKLYFFSLILPFFICCSKTSDTNNSNGNTQDDGWTLGSTNYKTVSTYRGSTIYFGTHQTKTIWAIGYEVGGDISVQNSFSVWFQQFPTVAKEYNIVGMPDWSVSGLGADECVVLAARLNTSPTYSYYTVNAITETGKKVEVIITGGKMKIIVPTITMQNVISTSPPTQTVYGTIIER